MTDHHTLTSAQQWNEMVRQVIEHESRAAFESILADDFVQESRRVDRFGIGRAAMLELYDTMKELDFHITGTDVAVAGDLHVLTRRGFVTPQTNRELLAISEWTGDGRLARLIEFDVDDVDAALTELAAAAGQPAVLLDPPQG